MNEIPALTSRTLRIVMAVDQIFSLLLRIHRANLFGFQRNSMLSHMEEMVPNEVPGLISRIDTATRGFLRIDLIGRVIATKSAQPTIGLTEILGGTSLLGGTETCQMRTGTIVLGGT